MRTAHKITAHGYPVIRHGYFVTPPGARLMSARINEQKALIKMSGVNDEPSGHKTERRRLMLRLPGT
ncbi:MAG TPA: hypothetical protein GX400_22320 [Chloroflexi bacterium]|nr:hypothetical protein [Chloroflexota bacterium]